MTMKEMNLKLNKQMVEIDETSNIIEMLEQEDEQPNRTIKVITYYLNDNSNDWTENPIFSIVAWYENYRIVHHHLGSEVFDDVYSLLVKYNLIESL